MIAHLARMLVRRRLRVGVGLAVVTVLAAFVGARIPFDFTPQALFAGRDDLLALNEEVKQQFGHSDNVVVVVQAAQGPDDLLAPAALEWHRRLCLDFAKLPAVERVDAIGTLRMPRFRPLGGLFTGTPVVMIPVLNHGPIDDPEAALVRRKVDGQPLIDGVLVSADRRAAAIALHLDPQRKDMAHVSEQIDMIRGVLAGNPPPKGYEAFLGGLPALRVQIIESLKRDQLTIIPASAAAFALIEFLLFRCAAGVVVPALAVGVGLVWTLAALVVLGQSLTVVSNVLPILLMICGVSSCVHFLSAYAEEAARRPHQRLRAVRLAAVHMIPACFLTSLTTALGFLSLMFAHSQLLGDLGWQAALGIALFYVASVAVCTTALGAFAPPRHTSDFGEAPTKLAAFAQGAGCWAARRPWSVVGVFAAGMAAAAWLATQVVIDSSLLETYDDDHPEVRQMRFIEDHLAGFVPLELVIEGPRPKWYLDPVAWTRLRHFAERAGDRPEVLLVRSLGDVFGQIDALLPGGEPLSAATSGDPAALTPRLQQIDRALQSYARQERAGVPIYVADDQRTLRVALRLRDVGAQGNLRLADELRREFDATFPPAAGATLRVTGESYVAAAALTGFIRELLGSLLGVSALIFVVIGALLKSVRLGLASVAPNVAPLLATVAYLVLRDYPLNVGNVIVFAISLGIAVDDTIHFLTRFRHELHHTGDVDQAISRTCLGSGRAIVMTTLLIVCGLAILLGSAFLPTRRFAELATVTMVAALAGDLLLLPASLKLLVSTPPAGPTSAPPRPSVAESLVPGR